MRPPIIPRIFRQQIGRQPTLRQGTSRQSRGSHHDCNSERGVTLLLVAVAMLAIIGMAALAIDVVTLYLAREEAQRSADAGALAGARILSLTGVTGDPDNTTGGLSAAPWPTACSLAIQVAQAAAIENSVDSQAGTPTVTFLYPNGSTTNCDIGGNQAFGLNPQVQVQVVRNNLPTLFSRIWSSATNSVSATATAEAYNSSDSANYTASGDLTPVGPRCVKPLVISNRDPGGGGLFVGRTKGIIRNPGIHTGGGTAGGVIGETFNLTDACGVSANCQGEAGQPANAETYIPALISTSPSPTAVPSCATDSFQEAIAGCDVATQYNCGNNAVGMQVDFTINPYTDINAAASCLTSAADVLNYGTFPFQINAGPNNPYASTGQQISASNSIVTLPILDTGPSAAGATWPGGNGNYQPQATVLGFLQVFIDQVNGSALTVTILNVTGCSNGQGPDPVGQAVLGSSPVPVRLVTTP